MQYLTKAKEVAIIITILSPFVVLAGSVLGAGMWQLWGPSHIVPVLREELGINKDAQNIETVRQLAIRALGEDRVIKQPPGLSYVQEPVSYGDPIDMIIVFQRTATGAACRFIEARAIFEDASGIPIVSRDKILPQQQVGAEMVRMRVTVQPPETIKSGRVLVYISMDYECAGKYVPEKTYGMPFLMLPG